MALNKNKIEILSKSKEEINDYYSMSHDWWWDDLDDYEEYEDIYEYEDFGKYEECKYITRTYGIPHIEYRSSWLRKIDMESFYDIQTLRQKRIDQILGISLDFKIPTFGDLFPTIYNESK